MPSWGLEWTPVDPFTGMAEIAAVPKESITGVVAALVAVAGVGAQQFGDRRWCAERAAVGGGAEGDAAGQAGIDVVGRAAKQSGAPMRAVCAWIAPRIWRRARRGGPHRAA